MDWEQHRREMAEHMAEAFGRPPEGQEHRAWVDHPRLRVLDPEEDSYEWEKSLGYLGLDQLDAEHPDLPEPLRDLLRCTEEPAWHGWLMAGSWIALTTGLAALTVGVFGAPWFAVVPLGVACAVVVLVGMAVLEPAVKAWASTRDEAPAWSARARKTAALDRLEALPFVVRVGDKLVENVPTLARLIGWENELAQAASDAERRIGELEELRDRMRQLHARLGESGEDAQLASLRELWAREQVLRDRASALRERVRERRSGLEASLAEIRDRAELEALRDRARDLAGDDGDDTPARLGAALELDVSDLGEEVESLRREVADEVAKVAAINEVSALG